MDAAKMESDNMKGVLKMKGKKLLALVVATLLAFSLTLPAFALTAADGTDLNGSHYTLNIIGMQKDKTATMDTSNGHVIFVPLDGSTKINLQEGDDFAVLDANATDKDGALLQLPNPGLDPYIIGGDMSGVDTISDYSVFVRPLGKPGGFATITTCADLNASALEDFLSAKLQKTVLVNASNPDAVVSIEQVGQDITMRTTGKTSFTNVTAQLLTIVFQVEITVDGETMIETVRVPIFSDILENEYWQYDNNGLKLLQVRFYPFGTDVSAGDSALAG